MVGLKKPENCLKIEMLPKGECLKTLGTYRNSYLGM